MFLEENGTAAEEDVSFHLVALAQELLGVFQFEVVVMFIGLRSEAYFLYFNFYLFGFEFLLPLLLLVEEFGVVDEAADGWNGVRRDLNEVNAFLLRKLQGLSRRHDF